MSKTNTRKGLSLATVAALAASLFMGVAPAQAANEVTISPKAGTTYAAISGETFTVSAVAGATIPQSSWNTLAYRITNTANATFSATVSQGASTAGVTGVTSSARVLSTSNTVSAVAELQITTDTTTSDVVFGVQAWLDSNKNGVVDGSEYATAVQSVEFFAKSNVTFTTTLTPIALGDTKLVANVTTNKNLNLSQLNSSLGIGFASISATATYSALSNAVSVSAAGAFTAGPAVTVDTAATSGKVEFTFTPVAGETYIAQAVYAGAEVGAEADSITGAAPVASFSAPALTKTANTKVDKIRTGTATAKISSVVSKSAGVKAAAGTVVKVKIAEAAAAGFKGSLTAGGKTLSNSSTATVQNIEFDAAVDADSKVVVDLALDGLVDGNQFVVTFTNGLVTRSTTFTVQDTTVTELQDFTLLGEGAVLRVVSGASFDLVFGAIDQFDQPMVGDYDVLLTNAASTATQSAKVVGGKVTFTVKDDSTKTEGAYNAILRQYSTNTKNYEPVGTVSKSNNVSVVASIPAASSLTLAASTASNLALNVGEQFAADTRVGVTGPETELDAANQATLSGQILAANGVGTYGVVTLSAPDVMFEVGGVYSLGSVTVQTDVVGQYSGVKAFRQKAGKVTISAAVGTVTKDISVTFKAAEETSAAVMDLKTLSGGQAVTQVAPGTTFTVTGNLKDQFGNPVKVTTAGILAIKYSGPGIQAGVYPAAGNSDADGDFQFSVLLGSAESGTATITVTYEGDETITKAVTLAIVAPAAPAAPEVNAVIGSFNSRVAVRVENAKGSVVSVKIGGSWFKYTSLNDNYLFSRKSVKGRTVAVAVYVNGTLENVATITVK